VIVHPLPAFERCYADKSKVMSLNVPMRKVLLPFLVVCLLAYAAFVAFIWRSMRQPPETFGRVMARMPVAAYLVLPFETLWTHARAGPLQIGDTAPDFSLMKVDKNATIQLAALNSQRPVVLVFGSYT
jgi:hypothetical protein